MAGPSGKRCRHATPGPRRGGRYPSRSQSYKSLLLWSRAGLRCAASRRAKRPVIRTHGTGWRGAQMTNPAC
jgi:hypothetical protein